MGYQVSSAAGSPELPRLKSGSPTQLQDWSGLTQLAHCVLPKAGAAGSVIKNNQIKVCRDGNASKHQGCWAEQGRGSTRGTEIHSLLCSFYQFPGAA